MTESNNDGAVFEIAEPRQEVPEKITVDQLQGWSQTEIEAAKKHGMVAEEKKEEKQEEKPAEPEKKEEKPEAPEAKKETVEMPEDASEEEMGQWTQREQGFFKEAKRARRTKQWAQMERERMAAELKLEREARERERKELDELRAQLKKGLEEDGVYPEEQPLTEKRLKEMREKEREEEEAKSKEEQSRQERIAQATQVQWEHAKEKYPDFDQTLELTKDILQNFQTIELDPETKDEIAVLYKQMEIAAKNADQFSPDQLNATGLAYRIGKLHPKYGKHIKAETTTGPDNPTKANGGLTPEEIARMKENTTRRGSSASISGGGGRRVVSAEDMTLEDLHTLMRNSPEEYRKFRSKYPQRVAELIR